MELRNDNNTTLDKMQGNFPHIYDVYNDKTILYALLSIYASKYDLTREIIDRIYGMIGIETTYDEDLEHRWGSMLGIYKEVDETYDDYRARLMIVYASFSGGTKEAIKYAVAVTVGISTEKDVIDRYIKIIDAWEYPNELLPHDTDPAYDPITNNSQCLLNSGFILNRPYDAHKNGAFVCTIDLSIDESIHYYKDKIMNAINQTRASGINAYLAFLYISNEIADIVRNCDTETMIVRESSNDECMIPAYERPMYPSSNNIYRLLNKSFVLNERMSELDYKVEQLIDKITIKTDIDNANIGRVKSKIWHHGYGDTNRSMITNEFEDTDFVYDRIILNQVLDVGSIGSDSDKSLDTVKLPDVEQTFIISTRNTFKAVTNNIHSLLNDGMKLSVPINTAEVDDKLVDTVKQTIHEVSKMHSSYSSEWSRDGLNTSKVLNINFKTNMLAETDAFSDIIIKGGIRYAVQR